MLKYWRRGLPRRYVSNIKTLPPFQTADLAEYAKFVALELTILHKNLPGTKSLMIGGVPEFAAIGSPLDCISRPFQSPRCATSPRSSPNARPHTHFNEIIAGIANKSFAWLNPFDFLCNQTHCRNMTPDGNVIYSDPNHLSAWGSEYFIRAIGPVLEKELSLRDLRRRQPQDKTAN